MKTILRFACFYLFLYVVIIGFYSCDVDDNDDYPRTYSLSEVVSMDASQYVIDEEGIPRNIDLDIGSFSSFRDTIGTFIERSFSEHLFIERFTLMSDELIQIQFLFDGVPVDTTLMYSIQEGELFIENVAPISALLTYDESTDEFIQCLEVTGAINGPNPIIDPFSYEIIVQPCTRSALEVLERMILQFDFAVGDTLGIFLPGAHFR